MVSSLASEFGKPSVEHRTLRFSHLFEESAHTPAAVSVDDSAAEFAGAAAVVDAEAEFATLGKRLRRVHVAALRAQFRDPCDDAPSVTHGGHFRFSEELKSWHGALDRKQKLRYGKGFIAHHGTCQIGIWSTL